MIKSALFSISGPIPDAQMKTVLDMATADIKANRIFLKKRTSRKDAVTIVGLCLNVLKTHISG